MKKKRHGSNFYEFILMALLGTGSLRYEELWETFIQLVSHFTMGSRYFAERFSKRKRESERRRRYREREPIESTFKENLYELSTKGMIRLNQEGKYELTEEGRKQAQEYSRGMKKGAAILRNQIVSPTATARNTVIVDLFLALTKLVAGFMSGSVALIADGAMRPSTPPQRP
jgi:hypothetical protein